MKLPFKLLIITDWSRPDCLSRVGDALKAGPGIAVQHRHPGATDRQFYEEGLRLKDVCGAVPLFVNGRLDVALALDAHLHLTERSLLPGEVRPRLGSRWLSASCHPWAEMTTAPPFSPSEVEGRTAARGGRWSSTPLGQTGPFRPSTSINPPSPHPDSVDFLLVSPVFDPLSKPRERPPLGVEAFHAFAAASPTPCFALGGITLARLPALRPVAGIAVIGEVMHAASPAHAAEALLRALE